MNPPRRSIAVENTFVPPVARDVLPLPTAVVPHVAYTGETSKAILVSRMCGISQFETFSRRCRVIHDNVITRQEPGRREEAFIP